MHACCWSPIYSVLSRTTKVSALDVRVHTRYKNGSCEIIQQFFETFGREKSCMIEQEPF